MSYFTPTRSATLRAPLWPTIWVVIGVVVAAVHDYFANVNTLKEIVSAILAVLLWPLLLIGINLHVH
jgi:hypothetical protein